VKTQGPVLCRIKFLIAQCLLAVIAVNDLTLPLRLQSIDKYFDIRLDMRLSCFYSALKLDQQTVEKFPAK
jgi:hypothetical protein